MTDERTVESSDLSERGTQTGTLTEAVEGEAIAAGVASPSSRIEAGDEVDDIIDKGVRYIRGRRGGDLLTILMPTLDATARAHLRGNISFLVLVKGDDREHQWIRVKQQLIEIYYRGHKDFEEEFQHSLYYPAFLRKSRVLFDREWIGAKFCDLISKRFRQGPPTPSFNEKIHLKAECYHWLGKVHESQDDPETVNYVLPLFIDHVVNAWFRLRGFWHVPVVEELRFVASRDKVVGDGIKNLLNERDTAKRIALAQRLADQVLREVPWPPRVD